MPCKVPTDTAPHQCKKLAARGESEPDGNDHVWPTEGVLLVSRCEVYCSFCYEAKGTTNRWKFPWHLRRHVQNVHAQRTHPNLICPEGWQVTKESKTGNRKPWREQGIPAPMGNYRIKPETPKTKVTETLKLPKTPDRQRKRQMQKKKRSTAKAASSSDTRESTPMPATPALTDGSAFNTPARQLSLPSSFDTPAEGHYNFADYTMTSSLGDGSASLFGDRKVSLDKNVLDTFGPALATALNDRNDESGAGWDGPLLPIMKHEGSEAPFIGFGWDNTMSGLELASNVMNTDYSFNPTTGSSEEDAIYPTWTQSLAHHTVNPNLNSVQRTWEPRQNLRIDGTNLESVAIHPSAVGAANEVNDKIYDALFDQIVKDQLSEGELLHILQSFATAFKEGR